MVVPVSCLILVRMLSVQAQEFTLLLWSALKGDPLLADLIYSGVPASWFGREQEIEVGPMSGNSNISIGCIKMDMKAQKMKSQDTSCSRNTDRYCR